MLDMTHPGYWNNDGSYYDDGNTLVYGKLYNFWDSEKYWLPRDQYNAPVEAWAMFPSLSDVVQAQIAVDIYRSPFGTFALSYRWTISGFIQCMGTVEDNGQGDIYADSIEDLGSPLVIDGYTINKTRYTWTLPANRPLMSLTFSSFGGYPQGRAYAIAGMYLTSPIGVVAAASSGVLIKDPEIRVTPGTPGQAAVQGRPATQGYWSYKEVTVGYTNITNPAPTPVQPAPVVTPYTPYVPPTPSTPEEPLPVPVPVTPTPTPTPDNPTPPPLAGTITVASMSEIRFYIPELRPYIDKITTYYNMGYDKIVISVFDPYTVQIMKKNQIALFDKAWDDFNEKRKEILLKEVATGELGRPLAFLSYNYGEDAYMAAWDPVDANGNQTQGVTFCIFQGFDKDDRPRMMIV